MQGGEATHRMSSRILVFLVALVLVFAGCAGSAWRQARSEDTVAAYHGFLREYPDTTFSEEARARLELARVKQRPTRKAFEAFSEKYGNPELIEELRPHLEETYFGHARSLGTAAAYRDFLEDYSSGRFANRARGNAAYLEQSGYSGDVVALEDFVDEYPESDYSAEAARTVSAVAASRRTRFDRIGLVIDVDPGVPGGERVARVFRDRAVAAYSGTGLEVVALAGPEQASRVGVPAVLEIRHEETETSTELERGKVTEPGVLASTRVTLRRIDETVPIWTDTFAYHAPLSAKRADRSILFGPGSHSSYWAELDGEFFVPVARWSTQLTVREPWSLSKPAVAVEVVGGRAVVLFGDGDFEVLGLSDPAQPVRIGEYRRPRDLATFSGVAMDGAQVVVFGPEGAEVVLLAGEQTRRIAAFGRETIGSVSDVVRLGDAWLAATNRGLLRLGKTPADVRVLVPRPILGMARVSGDRVAFADGISLYTATRAQLENGRIGSELRMGRGFHPRNVRAHGDGTSAVVLGARDAVWVDLRGAKPRLRSRIGGNESGRVHDAAVVGGRLFLLGPRGLQVADRSGEKIVDSVDVETRSRIDVSGRHLVMIGERSLQVVDATPFLASGSAPAAR